MKYHIFRKPYYNNEIQYAEGMNKIYEEAFGTCQTKYDGETEKAVRIDWATIEWGKIKSGNNRNNPYHNLWISKSIISVDYKEHDNMPWIYIEIPSWVFTNNNVFPKSIVNFEFVETIVK